MKRYKLLKDLPTFKAGDLFYISEYGALVHNGGDPDGCNVMAYAQSTLEMFPNILTEWFEEIQEPTDSIHWKPECGEEYWVVNSYGLIVKRIWSDSNEDLNMYKLGIVHPTKEECEKAHDRELAEVRLRRTSNFKPNFKNGNGGWVVMYDHFERVLAIECYSFCDSGEPVRYETEEEALKSIKENEQDWLIYFGIKEER